ncbi:MAG TPA: copper chaperone PCu(A)C [Streptosporangiaceae bacterium]
MLRWRGRPGRPGLRPLGSAAALIAAGAVGLGTAGCAVSASAANKAPSVEASTGYVPLPVTPGTTFAYLAIRNNARSADSLIAVRTSAGGRVSFLAPARGSGAMSPVSSIGVPAGATIRLVPNGPHLLITGAGRMQSGKDITLTLVFAHGGSLTVQAFVNNPADRDSNYLFD